MGRVWTGPTPDVRQGVPLPFGPGVPPAALLGSASMRRETGSRNRPARPLLACVVLGAGAAAVTALAPGGAGTERAVEVTGGASASAYRAVTGAVRMRPPGERAPHTPRYFGTRRSTKLATPSVASCVVMLIS